MHAGVIGLAVIALVSGCGGGTEQPQAISSPPERSCESLPEQPTGGGLSDQGEQNLDIRARPDTLLTQLGAAAELEILANDEAPEGTPLRIQSLTQPDLGSVELCEGRVLVYTPPEAEGLAGGSSVSYCLAGGFNAYACARVDLNVLTPQIAQMYERSKGATTGEIAYNLVSEQAREALRAAGHGESAIRDLNLIYDHTSALMISQALEDYPLRIQFAGACGGLGAVLNEEYQIMGESLAFAVTGLRQMTVELDALQGRAPKINAELLRADISSAGKAVDAHYAISKALADSNTSREAVKKSLRNGATGEAHSQACELAEKQLLELAPE